MVFHDIDSARFLRILAMNEHTAGRTDEKLQTKKSIVTRVTDVDQQYRNMVLSRSEESLRLWCAKSELLIQRGELEFDFPTIVPNFPHKLQTEPFVFATKFYEKYPQLQGLDFTNVLIAGGAVSAIFTGADASDVDMFIYGLNQKDTIEKAKYICEFLQDKITPHYSTGSPCSGDDVANKCGQKFTITRTQHTITVCDTFQIICSRAYTSKHQILRGFDLGACAVGFDGTYVMFTELGLFAHVYGYNVVDVTRCSATYEQRLVKYFYRGFGVILPNLDVTKLSVRKYFSLPSGKLGFYATSITGNQIAANTMYSVMSTYHGSDYEHAVYGTTHAILHNMRLLRKNSGANASASAGGMFYTGTCVNDVFDIEALKSSMLTTTNIERAIKNLIDRNVKSLTFHRLEKYFDEHDIINICINRHNKDVKKVLIDSFVSATRDKLIKSLPDDLNKEMTWITENPGTQLTGSFNPVTIDAKTWYADFYVENARIKKEPVDDETVRGRLKDIAVQLNKLLCVKHIHVYNGQIFSQISGLAVNLIKLQSLTKYDDDVHKQIDALDAEIRKLHLDVSARAD